MPVVDVTHDPGARTITVVAEFAAPVERVWQVYADPRQLERVYGPPSHPAEFLEHDLRPGGRCRYVMTSPDGERSYGWWRVVAVDEPHGFTFDDGFAVDGAGVPHDEPAARNVYAFEAVPGGTRATFTSTYSSDEALRRALEMGVDAGTAAAIGQVDDVLAATRREDDVT